MNIKKWNNLFIVALLVAFALDIFVLKKPPSFEMGVIAIIMIMILSLINDVNDLKKSIKDLK
jgi:drug/metabolite transporter (DMT)-like permease